MMVPVQEFNRLKDYYKGQMTENAILDKAGRLIAEEHIILKDSSRTFTRGKRIIIRLQLLVRFQNVLAL